MKLLSLILYIFFSTYIISFAGSGAFILDGNKEKTDLTKNTLVYSDSSDLRVDEVKDSIFVLFADGANLGLTVNKHWLKYRFINIEKESKEYVFYFPYHHIYDIKLYKEHNNSFILLDSSGTKYKYKSKDMESRGHPFIVKMDKGQNVFLVRVEHLNMPLRATVFLLSKDMTREVIHKNEITIWFWRGIFLFALFVSFILFFTTRIKLFLYYFLLNFGVALFIGMETGDFFMFFNRDPFNFIIDIKHLGNILVVLFFPYFLNELTPLKVRNPVLWKIMIYGIFVMPVLWFICLLPGVKETGFMLITVYYFIYYSSFVFILQIYFLFAAFLKKERNARALFITYFFYLSAVISNVVLPNLGIKNENLLVYNILMYGSILEIFTFMVLMGRETLAIYRERADLLEKQHNHQKEMIRSIVESREVERNRIGRELHDMIGANISVIKQNVDKADKRLLHIINSTVESVRNLSHGLITPMIDKSDFKDEIYELCILFSTEKFKIKPYFHNWENTYNSDLLTHIYRIIQELLQNSVKHSKAKNVSLQFIADKSHNISIMYEDDGIGFDFQKQRHKGYGLMNIENRVKLIQGQIAFDTRPNNNGTTVFIEIDVLP